MLELLDKYKDKLPEITFEWNDTETGALGWVVINSLRNGAAGGGTRMRKGLTKEEVVSLAKTMEIKFSVAGPDIGGAKSGIDFDPNDPRRDEVLRRWYRAVFPLLKNYYGTGGDLNVDEIGKTVEGSLATRLVRWTILPNPADCMPGATSLTRRTMFISVLSKPCFHCSSDISVKFPAGGPPVFVTRISGVPRSVVVCSTHQARSSASDTSTQ